MAQFTPVYGTITSITPMQTADGTQDCTLLFFVMTQDIGPVTFTVTPLTYVEGQEYEKRTAEQKRLIEEMNSEAPSFITMETGRYEPEVFFAAVKGLEQIPEGGERCFCCYEIRLRETARLAGEKGFDYFTTTLTISPLKNADKLNEIGEKLGAQYGVPFLPSDFKKKNGYKRSVELSEKYGLYRQDYCGCIFSKNERDRRNSEK